MSKPAFVEMAEKDMDFEADWVIKDLCDYAKKNLIEIIDKYMTATGEVNTVAKGCLQIIDKYTGKE